MKNIFAVLLSVLVLGAAISGHVMVSPPQSKAGITQTYELRAHNESKLATTELELQVPAEITVLKVEQAPAGTVDTPKTGDRITLIDWKVDLAPGKYLALKFQARNPAGGAEIHWSVRQHMSDGSVVEWSDAPGAKEKAPVTTISTSTD
jgi:uncharacterized protein YcnI